MKTLKMTDEFWSCKKHNTAGNSDMGCYKCDPEYKPNLEQQKNCNHKNHDCYRGQCNDCGYLFNDICKPRHTPDKLAEARELLKKHLENPMGWWPTQEPSEQFFKRLLEAQDLVSRAEQKKSDAEILNEYDCVCGRPLGCHRKSYIQKKILEN